MEVMKKFISYYKPYKTVFFLDMFCALVISAVDLAFPQILSYLNTTFYIQPKDMIMDSLLLLGAGLLVMYVVRAICRYYVTAQGHIMGARMESDMRQDLFDQFERLSFSYYDRNNTGEMMSKLVSDLFDISEFAHHGPENVFISLLKIIGSFLLLLYIHVPLTLILIAVTLVMLIFSMLQNKKMQATFMDNRRKIAGVNASLWPVSVLSNPSPMKTLSVINFLTAISCFCNLRRITITGWDCFMQEIISFRGCCT